MTHTTDSGQERQTQSSGTALGCVGGGSSHLQALSVYVVPSTATTHAKSMRSKQVQLKNSREEVVIG